MRLPKNKQTMSEFEETIKSKELIVWGRSKDCKGVCSKYNVKYIVDSDDELCDSIIGHTKVYLPYKLYSEEPEKIVVLICTAEKYFREIISELNEIGEFTVFFWNVLTNDFLNEISNELYDNIDRMVKIKGWLNDECSKRVFQEVVHRRICGVNTGYSDLKIATEIQYLYMPAINSKREGAILDCGGYIGDSVDRFVNQMGDEISTIYTFEALPENIEVLEEKKKTLREYWNGDLVVVPYAVSDKKGVINFCETEKRDGCFSPDFRSKAKYVNASLVKQFAVETISIDEMIPDTERVRFIKMDVEGAEYEALIGAKKTILRERPGLAISVYHNAIDYFRLAELIREYVPEYKLAVRHHKDKHVDTVLYAWI